MPSPIYFRLMVLLAKLETTYGVDPTLTGANNAILAQDISIRPMEGEDVPRNLIQAFMSGEATIPAGLRVVMEFSTELAGSGIAGTAPGWGPLMRGAGCAEVITATTSVAYTPISEAMESLYFKFWIGNTLHAMCGARGDATIGLNAQKIPVLRWSFTGLWIDPAEVTRATATFTTFKKPLIATKANTPAFTINGVSQVLRDYSMKLGNKVESRLLVNHDEIVIADRAETIDVVVEAQPLTAFDPFALAKAQTQVPISIVHGTVAGGIIAIAAPTSQVKRPAGYQNNQGVAERPLSLAPLPTSAGNDQFSLTLT